MGNHNDHSEQSYDSSEEEAWNPDEPVETEKTTSSGGTGVEESWDDEFVFVDVIDSSESDKLYVPSKSFVSKKGVKVNDDHYFLPAKLHAKTSCCPVPPTRKICGQFDDVE